MLFILHLEVVLLGSNDRASDKKKTFSASVAEQKAKLNVCDPSDAKGE
jgi:hypothetical protein